MVNLRKVLFIVFVSSIFVACFNQDVDKELPKHNSGTVRINENSTLTEIDTIRLNKNELILNVSSLTYSNSYLALIEDTVTKNR